MKWVSFILAMTILGLSLLPCADGLSCSSDHSHERHEEQNDSQGDCSPLCFCACCSVHFTVPSIVYMNFTFKKILSHSLINGLSTSYYHQFSSSVWHPPLT